jgi:hypothetical protein
MVINKLEFSLTDNSIGISYDHHVFIVQATGLNLGLVIKGMQSYSANFSAFCYARNQNLK